LGPPQLRPTAILPATNAGTLAENAPPQDTQEAPAQRPKEVHGVALSQNTGPMKREDDSSDEANGASEQRRHRTASNETAKSITAQGTGGDGRVLRSGVGAQRLNDGAGAQVPNAPIPANE